MSETVRVTVSVLAGCILGALLWPQDCLRTLKGSVEGSVVSNDANCTSVIGLPTHELLALAAAFVLALAVYIVLRRASSRSTGQTKGG